MQYRNAALISLVSFIALGGCSNSPSEVALENAERRQVAKQEKAEETLDVFPEWYLKPEEGTLTLIHAKASASRTDPESAYMDALTLAQYKLGQQLNNNVSGLSKMYMNNMDAESSVDSRTVIETLVDKTEVTGYDVVRTEYIAVDGQYRAFVMLSWDVEKALELQKAFEKDDGPGEAAKEMFEELDKKTSE